MEEYKVLEVYNKMQKAMIEKDFTTLNEIVLDGTKFVHMSGKLKPNKSFLMKLQTAHLIIIKQNLIMLK